MPEDKEAFPELKIAKATGRESKEELDRMAAELNIRDRKVQEIESQKGGGTFTPESFARAMGVAGAEEVEELYRRAEGAMLGIEIGVGQEPKFLIGEKQEVKDYWTARAKLSSACSIKSSAPGYDKLFPNDFANKITVHDLELLLGKQKGTWEAISLYAALIAEKNGNGASGLNAREILLKTDGKILTPELQAVKQQLSLSCPETVFEIKSDEEFLRFRESMVFWLRSHLELNENNAKDAEHIAWNLIYLSNIVEQYDSKVYRPGQDIKRLPPSIPQLKSQAMWMMMHPQERLEAKTKTKEGREGEAWSSLGEWALNLRKLHAGIEFPGVLPIELFRNSFTGIGVRK
ncbi:MAG: hypothetical protein AAB875_07260, partial [Patescibacteria group bacterium]